MSPNLHELVIIGAGGHGRELLDIVDAINAASPTFRFLGFVDDGAPDHGRLKRRAARHLGPMGALSGLGAEYVIGIGNGGDRRRLASLAHDAGCGAASLVHPMASIGSDVLLEPGTVIAAGARITTNVRVGAHAHLNVNSVVSHDCTVGAFTTISPGALVNGAVTLGEECFLGTGAVITPGMRIGAGSSVGAGAVVIEDVPDGATVVGVPAHEIGRWEA